MLANTCIYIYNWIQVSIQRHQWQSHFVIGGYPRFQKHVLKDWLPHRSKRSKHKRLVPYTQWLPSTKQTWRAGKSQVFDCWRGTRISHSIPLYLILLVKHVIISYMIQYMSLYFIYYIITCFYLYIYIHMWNQMVKYFITSYIIWENQWTKGNITCVYIYIHVVMNLRYNQTFFGWWMDWFYHWNNITI